VSVNDGVGLSTCKRLTLGTSLLLWVTWTMSQG